eukprot:2895881-Amphidinium_carterae.1
MALNERAAVGRTSCGWPAFALACKAMSTYFELSYHQKTLMLHSDICQSSATGLNRGLLTS